MHTSKDKRQKQALHLKILPWLKANLLVSWNLATPSISFQARNALKISLSWAFSWLMGVNLYDSKSGASRTCV